MIGLAIHPVKCFPVTILDEYFLIHNILLSILADISSVLVRDLFFRINKQIMIK